MTERLSRRITIIFLICSLLAVLIGCGGGSSSSSTGSIRITPASPSVRVNNSVLLTAVIDAGGSKPVTWSVIGGSANGIVSENGTYTAPSTYGDYTVRAAFRDNPAVAATVVVHVVDQVNVSIGPETLPVIIPKSTYQLSATVTGDTNQLVDWDVVDVTSGAKIDSTGTFTAPATAGTYQVQARSKADPSKVVRKTITVSANANVRLKIDGYDDVLLQLDTTNAPNTSANMVSLVNKGFYDGIFFHRWVADFVIQGGDPLTKTLPLDDPSIGTGGPGYTIPFETNSLTHLKYALAMARSTGLDTAGSQFYICLADLPSLDGQYCVFGKTISGFATVDALRVGNKIVTATTELP